MFVKNWKNINSCHIRSFQLFFSSKGALKSSEKNFKIRMTSSKPSKIYYLYSGGVSFDQFHLFYVRPCASSKGAKSITQDVHLQASSSQTSKVKVLVNRSMSAPLCSLTNLTSLQLLYIHNQQLLFISKLSERVCRN